MTAQLQVARTYDGPECPRCHARLAADSVRTGIVPCPGCNREFEATAFQAPQRRPKIVEVVAVVEGANACANHARNAAVTTCQRCGLFICALCDMNVGTGSYCPSCFDRLRAANELRGSGARYRDFVAMARNSMIAGLIFTFTGIGFIFGIVSLVYARKGLKQLRAEGRPTLGLRIVSILAALEIVGSIVLVIFIVVAIGDGFK